jgi:hypothetical protein
MVLNINQWRVAGVLDVGWSQSINAELHAYAGDMHVGEPLVAVSRLLASYEYYLHEVRHTGPRTLNCLPPLLPPASQSSKLFVCCPK